MLTVTVELNLSEYIQAAVDFVFKAAKWTKKKTTAADHGAASATGYQGAASATGDYGAASATGYQGAASATGYQGRASGRDGNALFLCERNDEYEIIAVWAGIVGRDGIKADTFYMLRSGVPVEVA